MASQTQPTKLRIDSDGVRIETAGGRGRVWFLVVAISLVGAALLLVFRPARRASTGEIATAPAPKNAFPAAGVRQAAPVPDKPPRDAAPVKQPVAPPAAAGEQQPPAADAEPEQPAEDPPEEAPMFGAAVPGEGIAVFPPPGTKPIKAGILVPENFELPPGYVRHYQATDDGQRVPAILMFHPDYHPVDAHGVPIPLPENRVVPPDMAPPGMPIQMLQPPENPGEAPDPAH